MRKRRRVKRTKRDEEKRIKASRNQPWNGIPFPEGSKRIVFDIYREHGGSIMGTQRYIKTHKPLENKRVPSRKTLKKWAEENHWETLRQMVDDGIYEMMDNMDDPLIQEAIKTDAALMRFLEKIRSQVIVHFMDKNSPLQPQNNRDALNTLKFVTESMDRFGDRMNDAQKRAARNGTGTRVDEDDPKVIDLVKRMADKGEVPTNEELAREAIRARDEQSAM